MIQPRPYQTESVTACRVAYASGARAVLLVVPTGGGKTVIGSMVVAGALERGNRVLWLAPRRELIDQAALRMPGRPGVLMAGRKASVSPIQVGSIDTIAARALRPDADLIVYDEAHHIVAPTSRGILGLYPEARVLGLTATPERSDGSALGDVFEQMVCGPSIRTLISEGHLVDTDVIGPTSASDALAADPVEAWLKHAQGRPGFVFAANVKASIEIAARLEAAGVPARHIDGKTPKAKRDEAIESFRAGRIDVLSSVYVFTEGVDLPRAAVCMLARGCGHASSYLQMVGRVLRPAPGKLKALVVDLGGVTHKHGLPSDEREWSLEGKAHRLSGRVEAVTQCPKCAAVWRPAEDRRCPMCGWVMPEAAAPKVKERELVDLVTQLQQSIDAAKAQPSAKQARLAELIAECDAKKYSRRWVGMQFKKQFGHWPKGYAA